MAGKLAPSGRKGSRLEVTADPNVIPFIDVMLVLLIIFMIAAPISSVDIEVQMPPSKIQPSQRPPRPTWITIQNTDSGILYYVMDDRDGDGEPDPVDINQLGEVTYVEWEKNTRGQVDFDECLLAETSKAPYCRIYIRADSDTVYRHVVAAMNRLQDKGFMRIGLVAEDKRR